MSDTYKRQFNLLLSQFKAAYPAYKLEKMRNIATDATSNFLNVERNLNNLFKDMSLTEASNDAKIRKINTQLKKYGAEISLYKKELKREKRELDAINQRSSAGEQFKEQYDAVKEDTSNSLYYDAFGVVGAAYLTYLVATSGIVITHH
jgi:DNA repair ATPase RecN